MKKWFLKLRKWWLLNKLRRLNPNPREYKILKDSSYSDDIRIFLIDDAGRLYIIGSVEERPTNGDKLIYEIGNNKPAVGYMMDVRYYDRPRNWFFATVIPFDYKKNAK